MLWNENGDLTVASYRICWAVAPSGRIHELDSSCLVRVLALTVCREVALEVASATVIGRDLFFGIGEQPFAPFPLTRLPLPEIIGRHVPSVDSCEDDERIQRHDEQEGHKRCHLRLVLERGKQE